MLTCIRDIICHTLGTILIGSAIIPWIYFFMRGRVPALNSRIHARFGLLVSIPFAAIYALLLYHNPLISKRRAGMFIGVLILYFINWTTDILLHHAIYIQSRVDAAVVHIANCGAIGILFAFILNLLFAKLWTMTLLACPYFLWRVYIFVVSSKLRHEYARGELFRVDVHADNVVFARDAKIPKVLHTDNELASADKVDVATGVLIVREGVGFPEYIRVDKLAAMNADAQKKHVD